MASAVLGLQSGARLAVHGPLLRQEDLGGIDGRVDDVAAAPSTAVVGRELKLVARHSPLCGPEIEELRQRIEELG